MLDDILISLEQTGLYKKATNPCLKFYRFFFMILLKQCEQMLPWTGSQWDNPMWDLTRMKKNLAVTHSVLL